MKIFPKPEFELIHLLPGTLDPNPLDNPFCECGQSWNEHEFIDGEFYCFDDDGQTMTLLEYNLENDTLS